MQDNKVYLQSVINQKKMENYYSEQNPYVQVTGRKNKYANNKPDQNNLSQLINQIKQKKKNIVSDILKEV